MNTIDPLLEIAPRDIAGVIMTFLALVLFLGLMWVLLLAWVLRRMTVGRDRAQLEALQAAPLPLMLLIDAIDLGLDFLGAPLVWLIMSRPGLRALRGLSVLESLIPGTQLIPTMTISWLYARRRLARDLEDRAHRGGSAHPGVQRSPPAPSEP